MKCNGNVLVFFIIFFTNSVFADEVENYYINGMGKSPQEAIKLAKESANVISIRTNLKTGFLINTSRTFKKDLLEAVIYAKDLNSLYDEFYKVKTISQDVLDHISILAKEGKSHNEQKLLIKISQMLAVSVNKKEFMFDLLNPLTRSSKLVNYGFSLGEISRLLLMSKVEEHVLKISEGYSSALKNIPNVSVDISNDLSNMFNKIHPQQEVFVNKNINLIAHSQGNSFANDLAVMLEKKGDKIKLLSIATPESHVLHGKGHHITLEEDIPHIGFLGSLPAKHSNYDGDEAFILTYSTLNEIKYSGDWMGHEFVKSYMKPNTDSAISIELVYKANNKLLTQGVHSSNYNTNTQFIQDSPSSSLQENISSPKLISPGTASDKNHIIKNVTPIFKWQSVSGAQSYKLYISKAPYGSNNIVYSAKVTGATHTIPSGKLKDKTKYRWNMRAYDKNGKASDYSSRRYFYTSVPKTFSYGRLKVKEYGKTSLSRARLSTKKVNAGQKIKAYVKQRYSGNVKRRDLPKYPKVCYMFSYKKSLDDTAILLDTDTSKIGSDRKYENERESLRIPKNAEAGKRAYILFVSDCENAVSSKNDVDAVAISIAGNSRSSNSNSSDSRSSSRSKDDIYIRSEKVDDKTVRRGQKIKLSANVCYKGDNRKSKVGKVYLGYYISKRSKFDSSAKKLGSDKSTIGTDDKCDSEYKKIRISKSQKRGTYYIYFVADYKNSVKEKSERNNVERIKIRVR